ncbi:MAG: sensor domain-containing diguanylate cyclase [Pseudomonadota bacterium]
MDLEQENRILHQQLLELKRKAQRNEATLQRFHVRELELLTANSLPELLNSLTDGMQSSFLIQDIRLVLKDSEHEIRQLLYNTGIPEDAFPAIEFVDELETYSDYYSHLSRPWLGPFLSPEHDNLFRDIQGLRSIAILPIHCRNQLAGSLNLGSGNSDRFTRHHASDFLGRLATVGGVCLENAINRERLVISGLTDPLTQLHNRRYLDRRLHEELARSTRYQQPLSCLFVDADHFKQINDNHGHQAGDTILRELACRLRSQLRASDVATRYGGEEFALLLPQTSLTEATLLAERIRLEIASNPFPLNDGTILRLTVSIGVSEILPIPGRPPNKELGEYLLDSADQALYLAKANGRNRIEYLEDPEAKQVPLQL